MWRPLPTLLGYVTFAFVATIVLWWVFFFLISSEHEGNRPTYILIALTIGAIVYAIMVFFVGYFRVSMKGPFCSTFNMSKDRTEGAISDHLDANGWEYQRVEKDSMFVASIFKQETEISIREHRRGTRVSLRPIPQDELDSFLVWLDNLTEALMKAERSKG
jgi:hypothetical protein